MDDERSLAASLVESASSELAETERLTILALGGCAVAVAAGLLVLVAWGSATTWRFGLGLVVMGVTLAGFLMVILYRVHFSRQMLLSGRGVQVNYVGWVRVPDGFNFALFDPRGVGSSPEMVMRLPRKRPIRSGSGWLSMSATRNAAVLTDSDGTVVAYGRIRSAADALARWERRNKPTPRWTSGGIANVPPQDSSDGTPGV